MRCMDATQRATAYQIRSFRTFARTEITMIAQHDTPSVIASSTQSHDLGRRPAKGTGP